MRHTRGVAGGTNEDLTSWIAALYADSALLTMGHNQQAGDLNLGLGWLYYGLGRLVHPGRAVVIGSYRGFVPLVIAKALHDNATRGVVTFIDPSMVDDFWTDPDRVREWVQGFGLTNIEHHLMTTQEFATSAAYEALDEIGLLFVDGYHTAEQARFDYETFAPLLAPHGFALFHDSMVSRVSDIYGPDNVYTTSVGGFTNELKKDPELQVFDVPYGTGLTIVRKVGPGLTPVLDGIEVRPGYGPNR